MKDRPLASRVMNARREEPSPVETIRRKRDGAALTPNEIESFVRGVTRGTIPEYQASALLMAIYFRGMQPEETVALTRAMLESGDRYTLANVPGPKADKHSTGGVGDKVSLILAPLAAACGLKVPMMSGRGLGHSGGTLDKLESIPGFNVALDRHEFERVLNEVGCAMIGQSERVAPADRKLYALRDVTGTVECIPLITASILSKKLAEGTESLVLDVKYGNGAFMKRFEDARTLSKSLLSVAHRLGLRSRVLISNMDQPLGYAIGNALEVGESIEILRGDRSFQEHLAALGLPMSASAHSADLKELTLQLCAHMLVESKRSESLPQARKLAQQKLQDGSAWRKFVALVEAQGGSRRAVESYQGLVLCPLTHVVTAARSGFVRAIDTAGVGRLLVDLGGGRKQVTDRIDASVGFVLLKKLGSPVRKGEAIAIAIAPRECASELANLIEIGSARKAVPKLVRAVM